MARAPQDKRVLKLYRLEEESNIDAIIQSATEYEEQTSSDSENIRVIYSASEGVTPRWKEFIAPAVQLGSDILEEEQTTSESFVCFLKASNDRWYAIAGGFGFHKVQSSAEKAFGTDILVRIIEEDDLSLIAAKDKSITGSMMASSAYYRSTYRFHEYKRFGSIVNSIEAKLTEDQVATAFPSLDRAQSKEIKITAGPSLEIRFGLTFEEAVQAISDCETILEQDPNFVVNSIIPITTSSNEALVVALTERLKEQLYELYTQAPGAYPFDICHNDFEKYLRSSDIRLLRRKDGQLVDFLQPRGETVAETNSTSLSSLRTGEKLFSLMRERKGIVPNAQRLWSQLRNLKIRSYSDAQGLATTGSFLDHIMGDVDHNGRKYFLVDKKWFLLEDTFLTKLDQDCQAVINHQMTDIALQDWAAGDNEADFNESHIGADNYLCVDRVLHENIEICDLFHWNDDDLFMIHVKQGFGNTLRELCNQIAVASARITQAFNSGNRQEYLEALYNSYANAGGDSDYRQRMRAQFDDWTVDRFMSLFDKRLHVVLAVMDTAAQERSISQVRDFNSAIGKFSIVELGEKMRLLTPTLGIQQIHRDDLEVT